jgi:DNA mismatch endonuclease, patch repair protein
MQAIKGKGSKPEMIVRRTVHSLGYRYRLHRRDLPGSPDLAFPRFQAVIFVHGCFWHRHACKLGRPIPKTRRLFWTKKFSENVVRDKRARASLIEIGWRVLTIWECEVRALGNEDLQDLIHEFLEGKA